MYLGTARGHCREGATRRRVTHLVYRRRRKFPSNNSGHISFSCKPPRCPSFAVHFYRPLNIVTSLMDLPTCPCTVQGLSYPFSTSRISESRVGLQNAWGCRRVRWPYGAESASTHYGYHRCADSATVAPNERVQRSASCSVPRRQLPATRKPFSVHFQCPRTC